MALAIVPFLLSTPAEAQQAAARREQQIKHRYLHLPVKGGAPKKRMRLIVEGRILDEFEIELAEAEADFWALFDLEGHFNKTLIIESDKTTADFKGLDAIKQSDEQPDEANLYREKLRPQVHFTTKRGWINDPNGLVYFDGAYHLFYQHNPYGWGWGNMHWGHAVSPDLIHWRELPTAISPKKFGDWAFSGSATVVDKIKKDLMDPFMLVAFTSTGRGECITLSFDHGRTWNEVEDNPVVKHRGRDPKVFRHEPSKRWVMAVYDEEKNEKGISFYTSKDPLRDWKFATKINDFYECPDIFELQVGGDPNKKMWVLHAADGKYMLGEFDGEKFTKTSGKHQVWFGNFYAAQSFSNAPDHRRIQIGWGQGIDFPGMPFNQQMVIPVDLKLIETPDGVRMTAEPVKELGKLAGDTQSWGTKEPFPGKLELREGPVRIKAQFHLGEAKSVKMKLRGLDLSYDREAEKLNIGKISAPLKVGPGTDLNFDIILDRGSIEVFANDGLVAISMTTVGKTDGNSFSIEKGPDIQAVTIARLHSIWER